MLRNFVPNRPLGYQQFVATSLTASTALTVPAGAVIAIISVSGQAIRYRDDGVAPTAAIGMPLAVGSTTLLEGQLSAYRIIEQAASAVVDISYYGAPAL
jgi:hypothetical protein